MSDDLPLSARAMPGGIPEDAGPGHNAPVASVSELSASLKKVVEGEFSRVRVRGEISGFKRAGSGHLYMALKDDNAVLDAVCWRGSAGRLAVAPEDGLEVIATGKLTTYAGRSKYQIVIDSLEIAGEGALLKLLEERRRKLAEEGLFDDDRKRSLPFLPGVIGVVTSPTGAVIRDILHRLEDRFPRHVLVWPVRVQGDTAAAEVTEAIEGFNRIAPGGPIPRPDLLIVARGGGSIEDLWSFNEEAVVRAAASSEIPLISAVGHETDTTLIDYAADRRAPTPTAAAEMAVPVRSELMAQVLDDGRRLVTGLGRLLEERRLRLDAAGRGLPDPQSLLETKTQQLDDRAERLALGLRSLMREKQSATDRIAAGIRPSALRQLVARGLERTTDVGARLQPAMIRRLDALGERLEQRAQLLNSYSYERVLDRGFALVRDRRGQPVTSVSGAREAADVDIRFGDGTVGARIGDTAGGTPPAAPSGATPDAPSAKKSPRKKPTKPKSDDKQGSLL